MGRKQRRGEGWSFTPADEAASEAPAVSKPPGEQRIRLKLEKRGKGKTVTSVTGLVLAPPDMKALAKELKGLCGSGGTHGPDHVEIQGDHRERIRDWMSLRGYRVS